MRSKVAQHGVLRDDRHVALAVPLFHDLFGVLLGALDGNRGFSPPIRMRNRREVLNRICAEATRHDDDLVVVEAIDSPCIASTPITRNAPESSEPAPRRRMAFCCRTARALAWAAGARIPTRWNIHSRREETALAHVHVAHFERSAVEPSTATSRLSASLEICDAPTVSGAMRPMAWLRSRACASSSVILARNLPEQHARPEPCSLGAAGKHDQAGWCPARKTG